MIKALSTFKRRPGSTVEEFRQYWQTTHAGHVTKLEGLRRYVQNPAHDSAYAKGREPAFDGIAETWFDDTDAMRAVADSAAYGAVRADEPNFIDMSTMATLVCNEVVIIDGPAAPFKFITMVQRRADLGVAEFQRYWREVHGPLAAHNGLIRRYVQNHARPRAYESGRAPRYDGAAVTWFDSFDDLRASAQSPELAATRADEANFLTLDIGEPPFVLTTELVVVP